MYWRISVNAQLRKYSLTFVSTNLQLLQAAGITRADAAVRCILPLLGTPVLLFQEAVADAGADMRPGQQFVERTLAVCVKTGIEFGVAEGAQPVIVTEVFARIGSMPEL